MSFSLGQAELILTVNKEKLIADTTAAYTEQQNLAKAQAKIIADIHKVEENDIRAGLSRIIKAEKDAANERKKTTQELLKVEQQAAKERQQITQTLVKYNMEQYKADVKAAADAAKEKAKAEQDAANERKQASQTLMKYYDEQYKADIKAAAEAEKAKVAAEKAAAEQRKQASQALMKYNQQIYAQDLSSWKNLLKERDAASKASNDQIERNLAEAAKRRTETAKRAAVEEAAAIKRVRDQQETQRRVNEQAQSGGVLGGITTGRVLSTTATLLGFGAIASGAVLARAAIVGLTEAIKDQEEAQRSLQAAYKDGANAFKTYADQAGDAFGRVNTEVEKGTAYFGILNKQYGVTGDEIQKLIKIAIDLQSAYGGDLIQVFRDVSNAIQGEPQALEKYGIALQQNAIKNSALLTAEEKRLYESMSAVEQAQIRLRVLFDSSKDVEGAAAKRAGELAGQFDALAKSTNNLALAFAKLGEGDSLKEAIGWMARTVDNAAKTIARMDELNKKLEQIQIEDANRRSSGLPAKTANISTRIAEIDTEREAIAALRKEILEGLDKEAVAKANAHAEEAKRIAIEESATKRQGELALEQVERSAKAEFRRIDQAKRDAEAERDTKLDAMETTHKAAIKQMEEIEYQRKRAFDAEMERVRHERDAKLEAIETGKKNELERIRVEHEATQNATEEAIRQQEILKERRKNANDVQRDAEKDVLELTKTRREQERKEEDRGIEDSITNRKRKLDDEHKITLERIEREKRARQEAYTSQIRNIDRAIDKEEERHRKATRSLDDELQKQLDIIDVQIRGIDAVADARKHARDMERNQSAVGEASEALRLAQGTGSPAEVAAARGKLTGAIRIGDPTAIKKAQDELVEISGRGNVAILEAQKKLSEAQQNLSDENLDFAEDQEKKRLEDKKRSLKEEADAEKRQEEDRNRRRRTALDNDKKAEKEKLDDVLKKIDQRKDAEDKTYEKQKRALDDSVEYSKRKLEDKRKAEDLSYEAAVKASENRYKQEQDAIERTFNSEEYGIIPAIRRAQKQTDEDYARMATDAVKRYDAEQAAVKKTYDDPQTGIIAIMQNAEIEAQHVYSRTVAAAASSYEAQRKAVEQMYRALDKKSGILDQLDAQTVYTQTKLDEIKGKFEDAKNGLVGDKGVITLQWQQAIIEANKYFDHVAARAKEKPAQAPAPNNRTTPGGIQIGPDPGVGAPLPGGEPGNGAGSTVPPPAGGSSGPQLPNTTVSDEVDMNPDRYIKRLGFGVKYGGSSIAGAGWEADGNTAAWSYGPTRHKGQDLILPGNRNGYGQAVGAFQSGKVISTHQYSGNPDKDPGGNYVVVEDSGGKTHWYMHLSKIRVGTGDSVQRGTRIGDLGDTGTEDINYPHLHYEVRNGMNNGPTSIQDLLKNGIDPNPYIARDSGYTFTNPTLTQDMRTGEKGLIAERRPERLLGGRDTQQFESLGLSRLLRAAPASVNMNMDYSKLGIALAETAGGSTNNTRVEGDTFVYNGVAPENIFSQYRSDQRRQRVLRGTNGY